MPFTCRLASGAKTRGDVPQRLHSQRNAAMSAHFGWYDDWKTPVLTCPRCSWQGTFNEGWVEEYDQLIDSTCPKCRKLVAIVLYPTIAESRANWDKLSVTEKQWVDRLDAAKQNFDAEKLKSADHLPDLDGDDIRLAWDLETDDQGEAVTVIRRIDEAEANRVIWRETAVFEGYNRFEQVAVILKQKYGACLKSLAPTARSELYLYGDSLSAEDKLARMRKKLGL